MYIWNPHTRPKYLKHLVGYYKFNNNCVDEISPKSDLLDSTLGFSFVSGKYGDALHHDSGMPNGVRYAQTNMSKYSWTDGTVDIPYSISVWVKVSGVGASYGTVVGKTATGTGNKDTNAEWQLSITPTFKVSFQKWSEGLLVNWIRYITTPSITLDQWVHIGITDELGLVKIYIDGVLSAYATTSGGTGFVKYSSTALSYIHFFGSPAGATAAYLSGEIDDSGFFRNYILSQEEITKIITQNRPLK